MKLIKLKFLASGITCCVYFFKDKLGMANGIVFSGAGLGMVVMPLAYNTALKHLGLNGALLINGVVSVLVMALILAFCPTKKCIIKR